MYVETTGYNFGCNLVVKIERTDFNHISIVTI